MAGFANDVVYGDNADFSIKASLKGQLANGLLANAKMWIGTTAVNAGGTHINVGTLVSPNSSITIGYLSPNITLTAGSTIATTYVEDISQATPSANILNVLGRSGSKTSGASNTITIKSPPYQDQGGSTTVTLNSGSFVTAAITLTLPASAGLADGDVFEFVCTTSGALVIQAVGSQKIRIGNQLSSAAGTATSQSTGSALILRFRAGDGFFYATSSVGTWLTA